MQERIQLILIGEYKQGPYFPFAIHGTRGIMADTSIRLSRHFGTGAELWLGLQADYDLELVRKGLNEVEILPLAT